MHGERKMQDKEPLPGSCSIPGYFAYLQLQLFFRKKRHVVGSEKTPLNTLPGSQ